MKIGVLTLLFGEKPLEQTFDYVCSLGVQAVEFGTGGCVRASCFSVEELLASGIGANLDQAICFGSLR
jgi:sugar phosphate isomerase/epimerase